MSVPSPHLGRPHSSHGGDEQPHIKGFCRAVGELYVMEDVMEGIWEALQDLHSQLTAVGQVCELPLHLRGGEGEREGEGEGRERGRRWRRG